MGRATRREMLNTVVAIPVGCREIERVCRYLPSSSSFSSFVYEFLQAVSLRITQALVGIYLYLQALKACFKYLLLTITTSIRF